MTTLAGAPSFTGARIINDLPDTEYHADRTALSSSGARKILTQTPAHFRWEMDNPRPYTPAFEIGHAAHTLTLGAGSDIVIVEADSWRAKAAREERDQALAEGKTPLLAKEAEQVNAMHAAITAHPTAGPLFAREDGIAECSIFWEADGVDCKARPDWALPGDEPILVDYKTTGDASPEAFRRSLANFGYHMQAEWYADAWEAAYGQRPEFVFVAQEKTPPYAVAVYQVDALALEIAAAQNTRARHIYAECQATGTWPAYSTAPTILTLPAWAESKLAEEYL